MKSLYILLFLMLSVTINAQDKVVTLSAEEIVAPAYKQAAKENKNVIILFHASWCSWCKKMDASMNDRLISKYFTDNYVIVHLNVLESANKKYLENAGAKELLQKYHGEKAGLPFFVILDKDKNLLADSNIKPEGKALNAN